MNEPRTSKTNRAFHQWATELADELNNRGLDLRVVLPEDIDIPWDTKSVKRFIVHPVTDALCAKKSTADLTNAEITKTVDIINRHLLNKWDFSLEFPSQERNYFNEKDTF